MAATKDETPRARQREEGSGLHFNNTGHLNYIESPVDLILPRLDGVKPTGPGKWLSRCPAHEDRSPSLSIRETDDGRVLIHCFAGCSVDDIAAAVGLELSDLFPKTHGRDFDPNAPKIKPPKFLAGELLELAAFESRIVAIAACRLAEGQPLSESDTNRVIVAADALSALVMEVFHG